MELISTALPVQKSFGENLLPSKKGITNSVLRSVILRGKLVRRRSLKINGIGKVLVIRIGVAVFDPSIWLYEPAKNIASGARKCFSEITTPVKNVANEMALDLELSSTPTTKNLSLSFQNFVLRLITVKRFARNATTINRKVLMYG